MTVQVLFVQGAGANAHDGWDLELVKSLEQGLGTGYRVRFPRMPDESDPRYATWKPALLRELDSLADGAILVGHSVGGTILLHVLADPLPRVKLRALILIATPFIGTGGWPSDEIKSDVDFTQRLPAALPVFLYHGSDDETVPSAHVHLYARALPHASLRLLDHRDHQLNNDLGEIVRDIRSLSPV